MNEGQENRNIVVKMSNSNSIDEDIRYIGHMIHNHILFSYRLAVGYSCVTRRQGEKKHGMLLN